MHTFFSHMSTCSTCYTYAYLYSRTPTCSTRHTHAYPFQPYTDLFYTSYTCISFSAVHRPVLHVIHMHTFFNHTLTYSTRHTHAYLFQPQAEVKEGVAGVCERCVRCSYPQVFTVQQHVQMSSTSSNQTKPPHPHPNVEVVTCYYRPLIGTATDDWHSQCYSSIPSSLLWLQTASWE